MAPVCRLPRAAKELFEQVYADNCRKLAAHPGVWQRIGPELLSWMEKQAEAAALIASIAESDQIEAEHLERGILLVKEYKSEPLSPGCPLLRSKGSDVPVEFDGTPRDLRLSS